MLSKEDKERLQKKYEEDKYLKSLKKNDAGNRILEKLMPVFFVLVRLFAKLFPATILKNKDIHDSLSKNIFETLFFLEKEKIPLVPDFEVKRIIENELDERAKNINSFLWTVAGIIIIFVITVFLINNG